MSQEFHKNLWKHTPSLCTFEFVCTGGVPALCGSTNNLSSVKHVNINVLSLANCTTVSRALLSWLVELVNIKSLIITSCTHKVLLTCLVWENISSFHFLLLFLVCFLFCFSYNFCQKLWLALDWSWFSIVPHCLGSLLDSWVIEGWVPFLV
jgi:hypothetical protein